MQTYTHTHTLNKFKKIFVKYFNKFKIFKYEELTAK